MTGSISCPCPVVLNCGRFSGSSGCSNGFRPNPRFPKHWEVRRLSPRMKAGEAVIELLRQEGVTHIFGIVGSSFLDILDPLYDRDDIQFVGVRHEQGAALMADGFSRISGKPGVILVTTKADTPRGSFSESGTSRGSPPLVVAISFHFRGLNTMWLDPSRTKGTGLPPACAINSLKLLLSLPSIS